MTLASKTVTLPTNLMERVEALAAEAQTHVDCIVAEAVANFLVQVEEEEKRLKDS